MRPALAARLSRALVGWHLRRWRERYGEEILDVLDQHQVSARTVLSLAASAASTHLDPAYRMEGLGGNRLKETAAYAAIVGGLALLFAAPVLYGMWQQGHWQPTTDDSLAAVAFSPHAAILVTTFGQAGDGVDVLWDDTDLSRPRRLSQFEGGEPTALSPDGRTVATMTFSNRPALWNVANPRRPVKIATLPCCDGNTPNLLWGQAFSPDGRILAAAYYDQILLWDVADPARPGCCAPWTPR